MYVDALSLPKQLDIIHETSRPMGYGPIKGYIVSIQWRIQGGGVQGVRTPPFGPQCRLFNIGPQSWTPPFVNVQEWGCFSIFLMADDVTQTMSKGGGGACECLRVGVFFKFSEVG